MSAWSDAVSALSPYAWYKCDETSGTTATDSSGNARHGTIPSSGVTYSRPSLIAGEPSGSALALTTGAVSSGTVSLSTNSVSYIVTLKSSTPGNGRFWESTGAGNNFTEYDASPRQFINGTQVTMSPTVPSSTLFNGTAHLLVVTVSSSAVKWYVDGDEVASSSHSATAGTITVVRAGTTSSAWQGDVDDFILINGVLTGTQVSDLHDAWANSTPATTVTLSGTLQAKAAAFTVGVIVGATLTATLQPKTAAFTLDQPAAPDRTVSLAGDLQRKTSSVTLLAAGQVSLGATLRPKTAAFTVLTPADVSLAGTLRAKTADFALTSTKTVALTATLRRKTSAITLTAPWTLTFAGSLRRKTSSITFGTIANTAENRVGGRVRRGVGVVDYAPPIVAAPASAVLPIEKETAQAFGAVTIVGTQPHFTVAEASVDRDVDRIIVGGKDITWWRGVHTPTPDFSLIQPLLYGAGSLTLPQLAVPFEQPGVGALRWLAKGKPVVVQRVRNGVVQKPDDFRGFIDDWHVSGGKFTILLGGEASGRAANMDKQVPVYRQRMDFKKWVYFALGPSGLGLPTRPYLGGAESGIKLTSRGGMSWLDYINEMCALAVHRNGDQWTIVPGTAGKYHAELKDRTTIHATAYFDDERLKPDLHSGLAEEPNRIFVTGVTPGGQKVKFGRYPGLLQGRPPAFPGFMTLGDTDETTSTGGGVTALIWRLRVVGYLTGEDAPGGYDEDVHDAVKMVQSDAGLSQTGDVNLDTWRALYDLEVTGYSMTGSAIHPAAQDSRVREFHHSPTGSRTHRNPNYRPGAIKVDRTINMGTGFTRQQMHQWAQTEKQAADTPNWVGTLTLSSGQGDAEGGGMTLIEGEHNPGDPLASSQVMQRRELRPGMNVWAPQFMGGTLFHVSGVEVSNNGRTVQLDLDTRARDTMKVWEVIKRNRESRHNPARAWMNQYRSSTIPKDGIVTWDEVGGLITGDVTLTAGTWTVFPVVAGEEGTVAKLRVRLADEIEFACAVFGRHISADRLAKLVPAPLAKTRNDKEGTGEPWYEKPGVKNKLEERFMLAAFGTHDEPCGYGSKRKWDANGNRTDATPTGTFTDDAGFSYRTFAEPVLYMAVWVPTASAVEAGRIMWQQREEGS